MKEYTRVASVITVTATLDFWFISLTAYQQSNNLMPKCLIINPNYVSLRSFFFICISYVIKYS